MGSFKGSYSQDVGGELMLGREFFEVSTYQQVEKGQASRVRYKIISITRIASPNNIPEAIGSYFEVIARNKVETAQDGLLRWGCPKQKGFFGCELNRLKTGVCSKLKNG